MAHPGTPSFGLDDFGLDDRMRLFGYVTAENRLAYLWVLRAFDAARASYHVVLHTSEVATTLADLAVAQPDCPDPAVLELPRLLDAPAPPHGTTSTGLRSSGFVELYGCSVGARAVRFLLLRRYGRGCRRRPRTPVCGP